MKRRVLTAMMLALGLCLIAAGAPAQVMYIDGKNADRVHLREDSSTASKSYGLYFSGTPVEAKESVKGFTRVSIGTENGFIKSEFLVSDPSGIESALRMGIAQTSGGAVNLRKYAGDSPVLGTVPNGEAVIVMGETANGWYYVRHDDTLGYMKRSLIRMGGAAGIESTLRERLTLFVQGRKITAELHEVGGGKYEREYRVRFLEDGAELSSAGFTGDTYEHLRHYESDGGSSILRVTDVNMDGYADMAAISYTGATEAQAAHFLYDPISGSYGRYEALDTLSWWRCKLYPEAKVMLDYQRDGAECGVWTLYRWEGTKLITLAAGIISDAGEDTLKARVFRDNEKIYEATWSSRGGDEEKWQQQVNAMVEAMLGGLNPGKSTPLYGGQGATDEEGGNG